LRRKAAGDRHAGVRSTAAVTGSIQRVAVERRFFRRRTIQSSGGALNRILRILILASMMGCTVGANLMLKVGQSDPPSALFLRIVSLRTFFGLALFGMAAVFYTVILKIFPLNVAQSFASAQYIAVICAAGFLLGEPIGPTRWFGIGLIAAGIAVVALSKGVSN
jgi:drug/metabolite transporter (DMT)-like permease